MDLPEKALVATKKELNRMKNMSPQMPEYSMLRNYIELVLDLPWNKCSEEHIDIRKARQVGFFRGSIW